MLIDARAWCVLAVCACASARDWAWPDQRRGDSVRIDTKVHFLDGDDTRHGKSVSTTLDITKRGNVQSDETPFRLPSSTAGFYNRPPGAGRYPVRVVSENQYRGNAYQTQNDRNDGAVDSLQFCKCVSTLDCTPRRDSAEVCGSGQYLCCFKRANKEQSSSNEYFNEIDDERPMLFPGKEKSGGPFPPPPPGGNFDEEFGLAHGTVVGPGGPSGDVGSKRPVLAGPDGPTGVVGPPFKAILSGPGGPSGVVGPPQQQVLVGPNGPTGEIGPPRRAVLTGPGDPGKITVPAAINNQQTDASAQRGILVGPGGPTGIIGPYHRPRGYSGVYRPRGGSRGVLAGPGGPTGVIGPGFGGQSGPGVLVGPGGPTGTIGPGRNILVGPGGPTGRIGPHSYYNYS